MRMSQCLEVAVESFAEDLVEGNVGNGEGGRQFPQSSS